MCVQFFSVSSSWTCLDAPTPRQLRIIIQTLEWGFYIHKAFSAALRSHIVMPRFLKNAITFFLYNKSIHIQHRNLKGKKKTFKVSEISTLWYVFGHMWINMYICVNTYNFILTEKAMAPHSSTLAWKIPWTKEPGRLQSTGSLSQTRLSYFAFTFHFHALEKEMATHSSVLAWRRGSLVAAVYGVTQSWTRLKWLSSSSSMLLICCVTFEKSLSISGPPVPLC